LDRLFRDQADLTFYVVESDSTDNTRQILNDVVSQGDQDFSFISLGEIADSYPERIQRIAHCRNIYLDHLHRLYESGVKFEYVVVADFDGVNRRINSSAPVTSYLDSRTVVTANQFRHYYDLLALRKEGWVEEDYRVTIQKRIASGKGRAGLSYFESVFKKQMKISAAATRISVQSAFGGLAIYPGESLLSCLYNPRKVFDKVLESEHVSLNDRLLSLGYKVEIEPGLRNWGSLIHTWGAYSLLNPLAKLASIFRGIHV
jgi:hypothetical protein